MDVVRGREGALTQPVFPKPDGQAVFLLYFIVNIMKGCILMHVLLEGSCRFLNHVWEYPNIYVKDIPTHDLKAKQKLWQSWCGNTGLRELTNWSRVF